MLQKIKRKPEVADLTFLFGTSSSSLDEKLFPPAKISPVSGQIDADFLCLLVNRFLLSTGRSTTFSHLKYFGDPPSPSITTFCGRRTLISTADVCRRLEPLGTNARTGSLGVSASW